MSTVAGENVMVHLPSASDVVTVGEGLRPPVDVTISTTNSWGDVVGKTVTGEYFVEIERLALTAELSYSAGKLQAVVERIVAAMDSWWSSAEAWLEIVTGQRLTLEGQRPVVKVGNKTPVWQVMPDGSLSKPFPIVSRVVLPIGADMPLVTEEVLQRCFTLAAASAMPAFPWPLVREARSLHAAGQYRRAVIDASGAAEVAVKNILNAQLSVTVPQGIADRLTRRELTLGASVEILRATGYSGLPANFTRDLVAVRNRAVHLDNGTGQRETTRTESATTIALAGDVVEAAFPLPSGLTRLW
ncbi:hypothetical protein OG203_35250 [Nocardia sp. NBC_01499]|uniref:hypothetical protein n=1 Tax=Nocardia sp. NBC_01499 TaxID=2903597 RepID=UPI003866AA7B